MEKVFTVVAVLEMIKRMRLAEVIEITKCETMRSQAEPEIYADRAAIESASAMGGKACAGR